MSNEASAKSAPAVTTTGWQANPALVAKKLAEQPGLVYRESDVPEYQLPEALLCADGTRVLDKSAWESRRRGEILELFREHVYGRSPSRPASVRFDRSPDQTIMEGRAKLRSVEIRCVEAKISFDFSLAILLPANGPKPVATFLFINNRTPEVADPTRKTLNDFWPAEEIVARGYAAAVFHVGEVEPDENVQPPGSGVRTVFPSPGKAGGDAWGTISAWAWAASRVMDYLETDSEIDAQKVAVVGHSRGGKTALWAGAQDQRFAILISNESGGTGAALTRRCYGETVQAINAIFPNWFCGNYRNYNGNEANLPVDQHELLALIAPRAVYVASADEDLWADPRGEFLSLVHASTVYELYSGDTFQNAAMPPLDTPTAHGLMGYHVRRGAHDLTRYDWAQYLNFADRLWRPSTP